MSELESYSEAASLAPPVPSFWRSVREALHGSRENYTEGPLGRAILLLAIPMVLEMVMESVFAVVDVFYVGRLGADAVATVGLTESLLMIVYSLAVGLSIGATAMVARRTGEGDARGASETAVQALALGVGISLVIGTIGAWLAPRLLGWMGGSRELLAIGSGYARMMFGGNAAILFLFLGNAIFRGAGDGAIAMRAIWLANGLNILLAPLLIFGWGPVHGYGVTGAAIATTIGRGLGALYGLSHAFRAKARVQIAWAQLRLRPAVMLKLLRLSASGMFQVFVSMASWIGLTRVLAGFGSPALAGYTIGIRVVLFAIFPALGLANASATLVGQSLGARKPERAEQAVWKTGFYNLCFLGLIGLVFVAFPERIISWFTQDTSVTPFGIGCLRIVACGFPFYAYGMVVTQSFNGAGDTWTPTLLNLGVFWLWEIPLAYALAVPIGLGPRGVFLSITLAFSTLAVVASLCFRRGRWKSRVL